jgi:magnesium transporter
MRHPDLNLTPELLNLLAGDPAELAELLAGHRTADIAESLRELPEEAAANVIASLPFDLAVQLLDAPELDNRTEIVQRMDQRKVGPFLDAMSDDQLVEIFRELEPAARPRLLTVLAPDAQRTVSMLLGYPEEAAGGLMTTEFVGVPASWTTAETLTHIARVGAAKETIYAIFILDPISSRLLHVVSLREVMLADASMPILNVGDRRKPITVTPFTDREEVARLISRYDLLAIAVVDEGDRMLGIVTVDDMIDALVAEQTEDVHRFGGMETFDEPYMEASLMTMLKSRGVWLVVLFLGQTLTATAMGYFEGELERAVILAIFIPLIISSGGNTGSQATSLIIRAMALREVTVRDWWRVAMREFPAGLLLGGMLGLLGFLRIVAWQFLGWSDYGEHYLLLGTAVGISLVGVVLFGSMVGAMLPFALRRVGFDPASASAPFVATLVDVTGILIYFMVAYLVLSGTIL